MLLQSRQYYKAKIMLLIKHFEYRKWEPPKLCLQLNGLTYETIFTNKCYYIFDIASMDLLIRYRPRFFDQVGHQTTYASMGNRHFFTK